jgi:hypothetical protein
MGLLDKIATADGSGSANYLKAGRHVGRLRLIQLRDPSEATGAAADLKPGFKSDIEILGSNRADFGSDAPGAFRRGDVGRVTDPFKYPSSALSRVRRLLAAAVTANTGVQATEGALDLVKGEGESDKDFLARYSARCKELLGPNQPLNGTIITFEVVERPNQSSPGKTYTLFEAVVPTADDLKMAGL